MEIEDGDDLFFNGEQTDEVQQQSEPALIDNEIAEAPLVELEEDTATTTKKKRKINRGPKLDANRLIGPRGLPAIQSCFKDFTFKGKGHEAEDLNSIMEKLEHWAHRLYPKYRFDDCIEKIEALGHKKEVQTCLKRARMGMDIIDDNMQNTIITEDGPAIQDEEDEMIALFKDDNIEGPPMPIDNLTREQEDFNDSS